MTFDEILEQTLTLIQRQGRVSYRALKRRFDLDDAYLEDLKEELLYAYPAVTDEDGRGLAWSEALASAPASTREATQPPLAYTPAHLSDRILAARTTLEGERKQVTVLFADIKGSTELIEGLDPEAARALLDPVIHIMMDAVHAYEGTVNQVLGDGIMALFGAPLAHEDHAVRAAYAALAMQEAMQSYTETARRTHGLEMRIRVGLNSGEVVVRTIRNDLHMDYSAVGATTHLAARMEQLANPGSIRLTADTLRLAEGFVQVNDLGPVPVKGLTEPVEVFELIGASAVRRRLQASVARGLTRFVGRQAELEALQQALRQARDGLGQVAAVMAEAGVGKSRLVWELVHSHRVQDCLVLESGAVSYGTATPYLPIIELFKGYFQIDARDDDRRIREKVTGKLLTLDETLRSTLPAFLALLDVTVDDLEWQTVEPSQRRRLTLEALKRVLLRESQEQPVVLICEDLHWIDSETQALLDSLADSLPTARLFLLVNYRPEYQHGWGSKTYYTQLRLDPLPSASANELLQDLLGNDAGLDALKQGLIERTTGNPLFLEECVRTLIETQALIGAPGTYRLAQEMPNLQMPPTVQAILAARIDRLAPDAKDLLQTAAVIGSEVPLSLLQSVAEWDEPVLHSSLTHLQSAEFLYETSLFPERVYTFKHALTHDVAYGSLLHEHRRMLHARILQALEAVAGDRLTDQVDRLAHHALLGEVWDKALTYFRQAGTKAMARSASREAVVCYGQALVACDHLPARRELHEQAIDLRLDLRSARIVLDDLAGAFDDLRGAERLAQTLDDSHRLGRVWLYMALHFAVTGAYDQATALSQRALDLAITGKDSDFHQAHANNYLGWITYCQGEYARSRDYYQQARALLEGDLLYERSDEIFFPAVFTCSYLALCHAELGAFAEGVAMGAEALHVAEAVNHPNSLALALYGAGNTYLHQGELRQVLSLLERSVHICREANLARQFGTVATALGAAYILGGRVADALSLLDEVVGQMVSTGRMDRQAFKMAALSKAHLHAGHLETASTYAGQALDLSRTYNQRGNEAYALHLHGDIAMHREPAEVKQAETYYRQALDLADELGMRPLAAHCHRSLGMLYGQAERAEQARVELSTAIEMYREMQMSFWLPETQAALAQVEAS